MERKVYEQGKNIFPAGSLIDRMIIIQSGVVQLSISYDKRREDEEFIIERLGAGAVLNPQAFIIKVIAETDYVCKTPVSCFELSYARLK